VFFFFIRFPVKRLYPPLCYPIPATCSVRLVLCYVIFFGELFLPLRLTPKREDHPLSAVRDCLLNVFSATLHVVGRSSIWNLRTLRAVLTGAHLTIVRLRLSLITAYLRILFVNNYLQTMCKEELVVLFHVLFWELPVSLRKAMRTFGHDHRSSGRDLNTGPSRYEAEAVLFFPTGMPFVIFWWLLCEFRGILSVPSSGVNQSDKIGAKGCPETSVNNSEPSLRGNREERSLSLKAVEAGNLAQQFYCKSQRPPLGQVLFIVEASRSHSDTRHSKGLLWTSDQPHLYLSTHDTHNRQTYMPQVVFEPAIPVS
jgi:hypothetical protein